MVEAETGKPGVAEKTVNKVKVIRKTNDKTATRLCKFVFLLRIFFLKIQIVD